MRLLTCTAVLSGILLGNQAFAQDVELREPRARQGYFVGGGLTLSTTGIRDEDLGSLGTFVGSTFGVRFGQMVFDWLGWGLVVGGGFGQNADWTAGGGGILLETQVQPWTDLDLAFRASVGLGVVSTSRVDAALESDRDPSGTLGAEYRLGASWDLFPFYTEGQYDSGGFAFTGFVEGRALPGDGLLAGGVFIGLEITYWFGLEKNKLELPPDVAF